VGCSCDFDTLIWFRPRKRCGRPALRRLRAALGAGGAADHPLAKVLGDAGDGPARSAMVQCLIAGMIMQRYIYALEPARSMPAAQFEAVWRSVMAERLASERVNPTYLPDVPLPRDLRVEPVSAGLARADYVFLAVPSRGLDEVIGGIDAVTTEELGKLARELWAPERLAAAGIGPEEERFERALEPLAPAEAVH